MNVKIKDKECLPVVHCDVNGDGLLHLDKGASMRMIHGTPFSFADVVAEFTYMKTDSKGRVYYDIPLRLVPLRWVLLLLHKLGIKLYKQWEIFDQYQNCSLKTVDALITDFKIGVIKHE